MTKSWQEAKHDGDAIRTRDKDHPVRNDAQDDGPLYCTWEYALGRLGAGGWDVAEARVKLEAGSTIGNVGETSWTLEV